MPCTGRPRIWKVRCSFGSASHSAGAGAFKLLSSHSRRRHQLSAGSFGKNADGVMEVRSRAKSSVPPGVIQCVGYDTFESRALKVRGNFVSDQTDLSK